MFLAMLSLHRVVAADLPLDLGFLYDRFPLVLERGERTEIGGPLYYEQKDEGGRTWAFCPIISKRTSATPDLTEVEIGYPIFAYDRFGEEFRAHFFQVISFSGGRSTKGGETKRVTLFPFYFQQRSRERPQDNYTALLPIYGRLKNRFFRDSVHFVALPLYVRSTKRDVVTDNFIYPIFHLRRGPQLKGWQVWPVAGSETRQPSQTTNNWGDTVPLPGHIRSFILWPFFMQARTDIGGTNETRQLAALPFYTRTRSPARDSTSYGFPLGFTHTVDRAAGYEEWDLPWPLVVFARGPGKHVNRVWPIYSKGRTPTLQSDFILWPIYKMNRVTADPLDRKRTRILLFLYSDLIEKHTGRNTAFRRRDFWPLYTHRVEHNGNRRLQVLAPLEPLIPNNKSIERVYSPVWSVWRSERNAQTAEKSQSLLWNLYRHEQGPDRRKVSLLFGLFHYESARGEKTWRVFYVPMKYSRSCWAVDARQVNPPVSTNEEARAVTGPNNRASVSASVSN